MFLYGIAANLVIHTHKHGLNKIIPPQQSPPPPNKVEVLNMCKICKRCLICNTQHCSRGGGGSTSITFSSLETQSVPNVLTRIVVLRMCFDLVYCSLTHRVGFNVKKKFQGTDIYKVTCLCLYCCGILIMVSGVQFGV